MMLTSSRDTYSPAFVDATCENTLRHVWLHHVQLAARIAKGFDFESYKPRLVAAYLAGEPVWMAADELTFVSRQRVVGERADREERGLQAAFMAGLRNSKEVL